MSTQQILFVCLLLFTLHLTTANDENIESCEDEKCFKNLIKTRPSLMIVVSKTDREAREPLKLLREIIPNIKSIAAIATINCDKAKKLCKKLKFNPSNYELKYYRDGAYSKEYDRQFTKKSLINFFNDPNEMPWEEEEVAKDVVHLKDENQLNKLIKKHKVGILVMFYAPWCGYCKKLKPDFAAAATELKTFAVMAGMNVDSVEATSVKKTYNITGYPTIVYFKNGKMQFNYGGEYNKEGLIAWMKDPQPAKEKEPEKSWAEEEDVQVTFLTDADFDSFLATHKSVLVMFYAPWCGHCKNMKPIFNNVAKKLIEEKIDGVIAAVDATKQEKLAAKFKIEGFPKIKYFKDGKFAWDLNERTEDKIYNFMKNPSEPPAPEPEWADEPSAVVHLNDDNFATFLKTKKHALVMFYAPWCGHCKAAKPHFTKAAEDFKDDLKVAFVGVDCTKSRAVCKQNNVEGFPTLVYFNFGKNPEPYEEGRTYDDFKRFMTNPQNPEPEKFDASKDWVENKGYEHVNYLDDSTFDEFVKTHGRVLVMFYAPWCGHCKHMKPAYAEAALDMAKFVPGAYLAAVDATHTKKLAKTYEIKGFPTLKYFENGSFQFDYKGGRTKDDLINFMRDPKPKAEPKTEL